MVEGVMNEMECLVDEGCKLLIHLVALAGCLQMLYLYLCIEQCGYNISLVSAFAAHFADLQHKILIGNVQVVVLPLGQLLEELGFGK